MLRSPTPADAGRLAASVGRRKRLDADLIIAGVKILGTLIAAVLGVVGVDGLRPHRVPRQAAPDGDPVVRVHAASDEPWLRERA